MTTDLSAREIDVLHLIADGLTSQEIADRLGIAMRTVTGYRDIILIKLSARNAPNAIARAYERGYLSAKTGGA